MKQTCRRQYPQHSDTLIVRLLVLVCAAVSNGCNDQAQQSASESPAERPHKSHARMLILLDKIKEDQIHQRLYFGDRTIQKEEYDLDWLPPNRTLEDAVFG